MTLFPYISEQKENVNPCMLQMETDLIEHSLIPVYVMRCRSKSGKCEANGL